VISCPRQAKRAREPDTLGDQPSKRSRYITRDAIEPARQVRAHENRSSNDVTQRLVSKTKGTGIDRVEAVTSLRRSPRLAAKKAAQAADIRQRRRGNTGRTRMVQGADAQDRAAEVARVIK
jgi:hypothetical protein